MKRKSSQKKSTATRRRRKRPDLILAREAILNALSLLTTLELRVFALNYVEELTIAESALAMGISKEAVRDLRLSGLQRIKRDLEAA